jgi:hypothetical protein
MDAPMLMRFSHALEVQAWSCGCFMLMRGDYESVLSQENDSRNIAYIKGGKLRNETTE